MKKCFKCGIVKDILDFYKHPGMSDGVLGKCKECTKKDSRAVYDQKITDANWKESERKRTRIRYHRLNYKEKQKPNKESKKEVMFKYYEKYPEKKAVRVLLKIKPTIKGNHLHHWSYNTEHANDCIELSQQDHFKLHRFIIYDQERKMYRRNDDFTLLDTKQSHIDFMNYVLTNKD